ncbi:MAG: PaaI family thioesterase [Pseudomonadota bacterium]|nr:PaaI family thioesterase [Pseudomonadota bacterium]
MDYQAMFEQARSFGDYAAVDALIPYARLLGIQVDHHDALGPVFRVPYKWDNVGNVHLPAIHGGVIAGLIENAAILHLLWTSESLTMPKVIDANIDYLRSGRPLETFARCSTTKQGRRIANVAVTCWQDDLEKPIAVARYHCKVTPEDR